MILVEDVVEADLVVCIFVDLVIRDVSDLGHQVASAVLVELSEGWSFDSFVENEFPIEGLQGSIWDQMFGSIGVVRGRGEDNIESEPESLVNHLRDESCEQGRREFQTWIRVDFNKPRYKIAIDHEIKSKDLKIMFEPFWCQLHKSAPHSIEGNIFHFRQYLFLEIVLLFLIFETAIQIFLELGVRYLIAYFIPTVVR